MRAGKRKERVREREWKVSKCVCVCAWEDAIIEGSNILFDLGQRGQGGSYQTSVLLLNYGVSPVSRVCVCGGGRQPEISSRDTRERNACKEREWERQRLKESVCVYVRKKKKKEKAEQTRENNRGMVWGGACMWSWGRGLQRQRFCMDSDKESHSSLASTLSYCLFSLLELLHAYLPRLLTYKLLVRHCGVRTASSSIDLSLSCCMLSHAVTWTTAMTTACCSLARSSIFQYVCSRFLATLF